MVLSPTYPTVQILATLGGTVIFLVYGILALTPCVPFEDKNYPIGITFVTLAGILFGWVLCCPCRVLYNRNSTYY